MTEEHKYKFDLFISYVRAPDGMLAKELERFLESFHKDLILNDAGKALRPLVVCIDNSDFNIPPADDKQVKDSVIVMSAASSYTTSNRPGSYWFCARNGSLNRAG